jgi:hypothetical protein
MATSLIAGMGVWMVPEKDPISSAVQACMSADELELQEKLTLAPQPPICGMVTMGDEKPEPGHGVAMGLGGTVQPQASAATQEGSAPPRAQHCWPSPQPAAGQPLVHAHSTGAGAAVDGEALAPGDALGLGEGLGSGQVQPASPGPVDPSPVPASAGPGHSPSGPPQQAVLAGQPGPIQHARPCWLVAQRAVSRSV